MGGGGESEVVEEVVAREGPGGGGGAGGSGRGSGSGAEWEDGVKGWRMVWRYRDRGMEECNRGE